MMNAFFIELLDFLIVALKHWQVKLIKKRIKKLKSYNSWHFDQQGRNDFEIERYEKYLNK